MESTLQVAFIAFAGVLVGALISGIYQRQNLKASIKAEFDKLNLQHRSAIRQETLSDKKRQVVKGVSTILAITDLEVNRNVDFSRIVKAINEVQLYLDPNNELELSVTISLNNIAEAARRVVTNVEHQESLLRYQGQLIESVQTFVNKAS